MRNWFKDVSNERDSSVFVGKSLVDYKTEIVSSKTVARETGGWGVVTAKFSPPLLSILIWKFPRKGGRYSRTGRSGLDSMVVSKQVFSSYNFEEITFTPTNMLRNGTHGELEEREEREEWRINYQESN